MRTNRELRSFTIFAAFYLSFSLLFAVEGWIAALYFGGHRFGAYLWTFVSLFWLVYFFIGRYAVRKAEQQSDRTTPPNFSPKAERWGLISAWFGLALAGVGSYNWIERLGQAQIAGGFKVIYSVLVPILCMSALLQFREARFKFRLAQRQERIRNSVGFDGNE
jgi:hypothetical protein